MASLKTLWVALIAVAIIAIGGYFYPHTGSSYGAIVDTSFFDIFQAGTSFNLGSQVLYNSSGLQVSSTGDRVGRINRKSTCSIQAGATTIAATTTATVDCQAGTNGTATALTGVSAGDTVMFMQSTTTPSSFEGLEVRGASASSTQGFITVLLYNGTGATFTWTAAASSSFQYLVVQ